MLHYRFRETPFLDIEDHMRAKSPWEEDRLGLNSIYKH
jgi:hypothetical protein